MSADRTVTVRADWDDRARVWVATSDDVPGLATEARDMEALVEKLKAMIPELLDANGVACGVAIPFKIVGRRLAVARLIC